MKMIGAFKPALVVACALLVPLLAGCGAGAEKPQTVKVEKIGNAEPSTYISVLETMSGPDRKKYIEENKEEFDGVMANATPEEKERLDAVMQLP